MVAVLLVLVWLGGAAARQGYTVRAQRGDQGPDTELAHRPRPAPPVSPGGPYVCRARARSQAMPNIDQCC